jgi:thymidylate synthase
MIYPETNTVIVPRGRIDDAWREVMLLCIQNGYDFVVKGGSYVGQIRKQLEYVKIVIHEPGIRPLAPLLPPGIPPSTTEEKIESYFAEYLMSDRVKENEDYTYGSFIVPQIGKLIDILNASSGNTNQACISIGDRESVFLKDPPCLRLISFKMVDRRLDMTVYFRSWDLYSGLPENLGGLQLVKEYVLGNLNFDCADGKLIAFSDGLHLYEQYFDLVNQLNIQKVSVDDVVRADKEEFSKTL